MRKQLFQVCADVAWKILQAKVSKEIMRESKMKNQFFSSGLSWLWLAIVILIVDRYAKYWMVHHLSYHEPVQIFSFLNLTLSFNTGAAFSFLDRASGWQNI